MAAEDALWNRRNGELQALVSAYFAHVAREDLRSVSSQEQLDWVAEHLQLAQEKAGDEPAIRIATVGQRSVAFVVTQDVPYLVDSVTAEITRNGYSMSLVVHPILRTTRDAESNELSVVHSLPAPERGLSSGDTQSIPQLASLLKEEGDVSEREDVESWIAVEMDQSVTSEDAEELKEGLFGVLGDVRSSHRDHDRMIRRSRGAAGMLRDAEDLPEAQESADLLDWMAEGNFLFLGYREYVLATHDDGSVHLEPVSGTGLGILAESRARGSRTGSKDSAELSEAGKRRQQERRALVITKANSRSTVRRRTYMDYVAVKNFSADGAVQGERRFLGLFSQRAYAQSIRDIPVLATRASELLRRSGFSASSHTGSDLMQILETYPRNELMQMDMDEIEETMWQILQLQERRRVRLFLRKDHYGRFMTALVYMPRDRYNTAVRRRVEQTLADHIDAASIDFDVRLTESVLARVFFRVRLADDAEQLSISASALEQKLARAVRSWSEGIAEEAAERYPAEDAERLAQRWSEAFPADYRVIYEIEDAFSDVAQFSLLEQRPEEGPRLHFYRPRAEDPADMRLKLYLHEAKTLTETLPVLDDFGLSVLDERSYTLECADGERFHLYDLGLCYPEGVDPNATIDLLRDAYSQVLTEWVESDIFSALVLRLQLSARKVSILRAYAKYMRQLGSGHSYGFVAEVLLHNAEVTSALIAYFEERFDPDSAGRDQKGDSHAAEITAAAPAETAEETPNGPGSGSASEAASESSESSEVKAQQPRHSSHSARDRVISALNNVPTLDADRVLSTFLNLIDATQRTNAYQGHRWISLKLSPGMINSAPRPRPAHEIWVYAPDVEGVHLRFDKVARGGLRWSDRQEDFRTEVLGLVKAQMVKNAVIVPSGAKGGFFAKQLPDPAADRQAWFEAGKAAYTVFIRGLLDITDNQREEDGQMVIIPPDRVVRHDDDDSYLVVAADKGTATFSDTANAISAEYGHWLGDAFASGGSVGYDHKAMGITARGAWESVKSHFSELGIDTQSEDFTVLGIGDLSGDVFGNGMLLSEHIRLVGAFNHLHIFIDPDPDASASFQERQRLFSSRNSGWDAYDESLISEGGGVFSRSAKTIEITEQMRSRFDLPQGTTSLTPPELIQAMLSAPVDLLYNGGIGTYVKSGEETHEEVGDRANNMIRIDGAQLRARVVGEGGNLGFTQAGRVEAALQGVLINTDAVDNSAGVDCSDHEVNIKILLDQLVSSGHLESAEREGLLKDMTEDVAQLVLQTNVDQNVMLLTDRHRMGDWSPSFQRLMSWLEEAAGLDRQLEVLPTDEVFQERADAGVPQLTAPELSVLMAYAKIQLKQALGGSDLPDDPWFESTLRDYFPDQLTERFGDELTRHPLQREIIANEIANQVIDIGGSTVVFRAMEETFASEDQVVRAFVIARELLGLETFHAGLLGLPVSFPRERWALTFLDMRRLLDRAVRWFVNHDSGRGTIEESIEHYRGHIEALREGLTEYLRAEDLERVQEQRREAEEAGMPGWLAATVAETFEAYSILDVANLAESRGLDARDVAAVYFAVYAEFNVDSLLNRITALPREDKWQALARGAQRDELYRAIYEITESVLAHTDADADAVDRLEQWKLDSQSKLQRTSRLAAETDELADDNIASLTVLLRHLRGLIGA